MKKLLFSFLSLILVFSCDNEPLEGFDLDLINQSNVLCQQAIDFTVSAGEAFNNDTSNANLCIAYIAALQNQIAACGDPNGSLLGIIDGLGDCNSNQQDEGLVGTWQLTAWIVAEAVDINNDGTANTNLLDEIDCYNNEFLDISADNTAFSTSNSFADITFEIEAGTTDSFIYTQECFQEVEVTDLTWTQTGNIVTFTDVISGDTTWTLSGNQLSVNIPMGYIAFDSVDVTVSVSQDLTLVYTKL